MSKSVHVEGLRHRLHDIIFYAETPAGKLFDVVLIWTIVASVVAVLLESVAAFRIQYGEALRIAEWTFTILFTIEYLLRLWTVGRSLRYAFSFFGIVDLLAVIPTYLSLVFPGAQYLLVVRLLRVLRVFRVLKLATYINEAAVLKTALIASRRKITVFLVAVITLNVILGSLMYLVEGAENGFTSIPRSIYWAIVTLTTVGYGDISPQTNLGQALASVIMIIGYAIIAVPTGIVTAELTRADAADRAARVPNEYVARVPKQDASRCSACNATGHDPDARHCKYCGERL